MRIFTYECLFNFGGVPLKGAKFHYDNKIFEVTVLDSVGMQALCFVVARKKKREPIFIE